MTKATKVGIFSTEADSHFAIEMTNLSVYLFWTDYSQTEEETFIFNKSKVRDWNSAMLIKR